MSRTLCCIPRGGSHPCTACCCLRCPLVPSCPRVFPRVTALPAVARSEGAIWQGSAADRPACPALGYLPGSVRLSVVPPAVFPACFAGAALGYSPRGIRLLFVPPALRWVTCPAGCECCLSRPSRLPRVGSLAPFFRVQLSAVPPVAPVLPWVTRPAVHGRRLLRLWVIRHLPTPAATGHVCLLIEPRAAGAARVVVGPGARPYASWFFLRAPLTCKLP